MLLYIISYYHFIIADAQVNPEPKEAKTNKSPSFIFPLIKASAKAMGIVAAVVFPYLWILER